MRYLPLAQLKREGEATFYDWQEVALGYSITRVAINESLYAARTFPLAMPHIWIPKPVELVAGAVAAAIIKNPTVTRRFWQGWTK